MLTNVLSIHECKYNLILLGSRANYPMISNNSPLLMHVNFPGAPAASGRVTVRGIMALADTHYAIYGHKIIKLISIVYNKEQKQWQ